MSKFRKKPIVIEAVQIKKGMGRTAPEWFPDAVLSGELIPHGMGAVTRDMPWVEVSTWKASCAATPGTGLFVASRVNSTRARTISLRRLTSE